MPSLPLSPQEAARELLLRRGIRRSLTSWATHALAEQGFAPAAHHRLLLDELSAVARGDTRRLMIFMPPGSAKSTYASKLFPAWFWTQNPKASLIGASHTQDLADDFSRETQGFVRDHAQRLGYGVATDAVGLWRTTSGGRYKAAGVGGPVTGFRADLALIDDPVKSRADAESQAFRDRTYNWYRSDLLTRLRPGGRVVLVMTRWHEDDLAGRLLADNPTAWRIVKLAFEAGPNDPLGRAEGKLLWADDGYGYAAEIASRRAETGERDWWSLYQQEPRPLSGGLFKVANLGALDAEPVGGRAVRAWDLAATSAAGTRDPDWTVGLKLVLLPDKRVVVSDVVRLRGGPEEVEAAIKATASRDGKGVQVCLPQDPGQAGKAQVASLTKLLLGFTVHSSPETGDKATRAAPVAAQVNVGNVALVRGPWNRVFTDELAGFPSGAKDDQVDALSRGFNRLAGGAYDSSMRWVG